MTERQLVLALVRQVAQPDAQRASAVRQLAARADPDALLRLLAAQRLAATLGGRLLDDAEVRLPERTTAQLRAAVAGARRRGLLHLGVLRRVAAALGAADIPCVPLKGAFLADAVYGDVGAREASDIDLLVPVGALDAAASVAVGLGWREPPGWVAAPGLPRLHRELDHPSFPPLELHWRVHWYEDVFAQAALGRAGPDGEHPWRRARPADELAFLLLFLARDGFAGLRHTVDVAAWWAACRQTPGVAEDVRRIADAHPQLRPALEAAAEHAEHVAAIPRGALVAGPRRLSARPRAALRLANPWLEGSARQIDADVSLADGLLAARGGLLAFVRRQLLQPRHVVLRREPRLATASGGRLLLARVGHGVRVLRRYAVAAQRLALRPRR